MEWVLVFWQRSGVNELKLAKIAPIFLDQKPADHFPSTGNCIQSMCRERTVPSFIKDRPLFHWINFFLFFFNGSSLLLW
jgi:hypothetical protein